MYANTKDICWTAQLFGIRLITNTGVVQLAQNAGFDALFIELVHSSLSIEEANQLCMAALSIGITPFVRVPYQCGYDFIQRVLDGGAMGVVFPHIHSRGTNNSTLHVTEKSFRPFSLSELIE